MWKITRHVQKVIWGKGETEINENDPKRQHAAFKGKRRTRDI